MTLHPYSTIDENIIWKIQLLGNLQAERIDQATRQPARLNRFRTRKTASLLAYLALNIHAGHSRDKLVELLWPEVSPKSGRNSLRVSLNALRQQLEPDEPLKGQIILSQGATLQLNCDRCQTDVQDFEQKLSVAEQTEDYQQKVRHLEAAIAHYGGELLPGDPSAWVEQEAMRLADLHLSTVYQVGELLFEAKDFSQALSYAHRSVQLDPLCDTCHFLLMQLQVALSRPTRAIQQYRELTKLWQAEFNDFPPSYIQAWIDNLMSSKP